MDLLAGQRLSSRVLDHLCGTVWKIRKAQKCVGSSKGKVDARFAANTSGHYRESLLTPLHFYGAASGIW